ncbi:hypothetical protein OsI_13809 [Oryza sativa Indica Group]|uniref:Uncharacterized protein n=1 Tax=Oryza sativa subsp. indica TaxID=39946 RepID=B8AKY0_ORYSI|nr:hypothetical protein OsI_13809 [Oryza sativa Indica Group]
MAVATLSSRSRRACAEAASVLLVLLVIAPSVAAGGDTNGVYEPCADAAVQRGDGFTFGVAFAARGDFFSGGVQLSPCDGRLSLASKGAKLAVFRPEVDEISLLTVNTSAAGGFDPATSGGYMVAFAGRKYAARSPPVFVSNSSYTVTSFTLSCAISTANCTGKGGSVDCSPGIQLAFSGTDKHEAVLNSWYEVSKLRQYSLVGLFSNLKDSLTSQFSIFF